MTTKSKIAAALTALTLAAALTVPSTSAQARGGWGIAAGVAGGLIVGAAIANAANGPAYGYGYYPRCHFVPQYDAYGYYIGRARVCR